MTLAPQIRRHRDQMETNWTNYYWTKGFWTKLFVDLNWRQILFSSDKIQWSHHRQWKQKCPSPVVRQKSVFSGADLVIPIRNSKYA